MSSYATHCQDQGIDCARRASLARSPEIAAYWRWLGVRWLRLGEQVQKTGAVAVAITASRVSRCLERIITISVPPPALF